jgi:hypothetical protein
VRGRENSLGTRSDRAKNRVSFWIEREKSEELGDKYARARRGGGQCVSYAPAARGMHRARWHESPSNPRHPLEAEIRARGGVGVSNPERAHAREAGDGRAGGVGWAFRDQNAHMRTRARRGVAGAGRVEPRTGSPIAEAGRPLEIEFAGFPIDARGECRPWRESNPLLLAKWQREREPKGRPKADEKPRGAGGWRIFGQNWTTWTDKTARERIAGKTENSPGSRLFTGFTGRFRAFLRIVENGFESR